MELGGGLTRGMMVVDRRPRAVTNKRSNVTLIQSLDADILRESLTRAFTSK